MERQWGGGGAVRVQGYTASLGMAGPVARVPLRKPGGSCNLQPVARAAECILKSSYMHSYRTRR